MEKTNIETLYEWLDQTTEDIQQHADEPYLDSLAITLETLFYEGPADHLDDLMSHKLATALKQIMISEYTTEDIRKSIQLAILKGMQRSTQPQHLITPETVSLLMGYLAGKLTQDYDHLRVFDPVSGSGNLLTTVLGQLSQSIDAYASEIDPTLIKLGLLNANLQKMNIELFHQDSLSPFLLDPVDLVVSDFPVGYYPDDIRANDFELRANEGHSYAHHLLLEQSLKYTKTGGYLILLIPEFLFDSDQSDKLHQFLQENTHIIGVLRLPETAFTSKKDVKSVLILQKQGQETIAPKQPLLVDLPSFKDTNAMEDILGKVNNWFAINTKTNEE